MTMSMTLAETAYVPRSSRQDPAFHQDPVRGRFLALLIAGVTALALVAASAVPAHADRQRDRVLQALAAIAAVAIIAGALDDKKDNRRRPARGPRVPSVCAIEIGSGRGSVVGYGERCLRNEGFEYRLPRNCATNIRIYGRADKFYSAQCLHETGFNIRPR